MLRKALASLRFELLSTFRDRHTLIYTVLVPLFLYPGLFFATIQLVQLTEGMEPEDLRIGVIGQGPLADALARDSVLAVSSLEGLPELADSMAVASALDSMLLDAAVFVEGLSARLVYLSSRSRSVSAMENVQRVVTDLREDSLSRITAEMGGAWATVFETRTIDVAEPEASGRMLLSLIVPLTLVVMTTLGAYYPAVDVAAGEKERRTAETTLSIPRRPAELVFGKLAAVVLSALLSLLLNLGSMFIAARLILPPDMEQLSFGVGPGTLVAILAAGFLFAVLAGSALLLMAFRADSFREAQSTAGAVYGLGIMPALVSIVPGIELSAPLALVPVANVSLLIKALLRGTAGLAPIAIYVASSLLLVLVLLSRCVRTVGDPERWLTQRKRGLLAKLLSGRKVQRT